MPPLSSTVTLPLPTQLRAIHKPSPLASIGPPSCVLERLTHVPRVVPVAAGGAIDCGMGVDTDEGSAGALVIVDVRGESGGELVHALNIGTRRTVTPVAIASLQILIRSPKRSSSNLTKNSQS